MYFNEYEYHLNYKTKQEEYEREAEIQRLLKEREANNNEGNYSTINFFNKD